MSWQDLLAQAEALSKDGKYVEGVQKLNPCMELFETEVGGSDSQILKAPREFLENFTPKLTTEQKSALEKMFVVCGDLMLGLSATVYACAALLAPDNEEIQAKQIKLATPNSSTQKPSNDKVPCTVITGSLGSGKTTLLNHILHQSHGKCIAVIENEFGEVGIDHALVKGGSMVDEENLVERDNGCMSYTVRGDLIVGLKKLVKTARKTGKRLDGVIIETTGLADPVPVAQTFLADEFVQQNMCLDGIITLVDAKHIIQRLDDEKPEGANNKAVEQIAFADRVLLNKCDLLGSEEELKEVERRIHAVNDNVSIRRTVNSEIDMDFVFGVHGFSLNKIIEMDDAFIEDSHAHQHDARFPSVVIEVKGEVVEQRLGQWISWLLKEKHADLFRSKGVLAVRGMKQKFVFQSTHMLFANSQEGQWGPDEEKSCKMVFIGKNLNKEELTSGFMKCLAQGAPSSETALISEWCLPSFFSMKPLCW